MAKIQSALSRASALVIAFGIFTIFNILFKCVPAIIIVLHEMDLSHSALLALVNLEMNVPLDLIASMWTALAAAYVGVDRAAMAISTFNEGYNHADYGDPKRLKLVIVLSFVIYVIALGLNTFVKADLALAPFAAAFGSSVLLYVAGQKTIYAMSKAAPEDFITLTDAQEKQISRIRQFMRDGKKIKKILFLNDSK
jgi:hypothetical protein